MKLGFVFVFLFIIGVIGAAGCLVAKICFNDVKDTQYKLSRIALIVAIMSLFFIIFGLIVSNYITIV